MCFFCIYVAILRDGCFRWPPGNLFLVLTNRGFLVPVDVIGVLRDTPMSHKEIAEVFNILIESCALF